MKQAQFVSSHVFIALEFYKNHFVILIWKIVKSCYHNEIKPPIGKIFRKYEAIRHFFVISPKKLSCLLVNKVYNNYTKVSYLQRNESFFSTWKKVDFSQSVRFIRRYYLTTFQIPVTATLNVLLQIFWYTFCIIIFLSEYIFGLKPTKSSIALPLNFSLTKQMTLFFCFSFRKSLSAS